MVPGEPRQSAHQGPGGLSPTSKPIFGNFQRYYHIRNPTKANLDEGSINDSGLAERHDASLLSSSNSALDPRIPSILAFLEEHFGLGLAVASEAPASTALDRVLDIGCNSGKVTIELAQQLARSAAPQLVLGVDIDPFLVRECKYSASLAWSRCRPSYASTDETRQGSESVSGNDTASSPYDYFPACFPHLYGPLPLTASRSRKAGQDPAGSSAARKRRRTAQRDGANSASAAPERAAVDSFASLEFLTAEWVNADLAVKAAGPRRTDGPEDNSKLHAQDVEALSSLGWYDRQGYDVIVCLAVTKWIHVHHGDRGMLRLLARIVSTLRPGGCLLLESQPWKSYEEARRMGADIRARMNGLQLRPEGDFEWALASMGLLPRGRIGDGPGAGFVRHVEAFVKPLQPSPASAQQMVDTFLAFQTPLQRNGIDGAEVDLSDSSFEGIPWVMRSPRRQKPEKESAREQQTEVQVGLSIGSEADGAREAP